MPRSGIPLTPAPGALSRYVHTLRHLRPVQIAARVKQAAVRVRPDLRPAPAWRRLAGPWNAPAARRASLLAARRFRFLNVERELNGRGGWCDPQVARLWLYNLHYFDDLNARGAGDRAAWHAALIDDWIEANPPGESPGWEPYPLSLRIVNWLKWAVAGGKLSDRGRHSLAVQLRFLERRLEYHLLGNHLLANAKALIFGGVCFAGSEGRHWLRRGLRLLDEQLAEQILPDGGHIERSPMYHSLVLEDLLDLLNLAGACAPDASLELAPLKRSVDAWLARVAAMRRWLAVATHPDGQIAFFNDAAWEIAPEPAELEAYAQRIGLRALPPLRDRVVHLADTGLVRVAMGAAVLLADVGVLGPDYLPGHAHADTLSFEWSLDGQRVVVNGGTSSYEPGPTRDAQRGTAAHSTVVIDEADSSEMWGSFRVARRARPDALSIRETPGEVTIQCEHDGYRRLRGKPVHRRRWHLGKSWLTVVDIVDGNFFTAEARYHLHPRVRVEPSQGEPPTFQLQVGERSVRWQPQHCGYAVEADEFHPEFGVSQPSTCLRSMFRGPYVTNQFEW